MRGQDVRTRAREHQSQGLLGPQAPSGCRPSRQLPASCAG
uniref:Uncharacterized protein n=1 Tax=Arundo donax TaxID=35708 RepID=A0A0A9H5B4_ARUDO